ncbi:MAG: hypothetical protein RSB45_03610, partial [Bacilli bacterium]
SYQKTSSLASILDNKLPMTLSLLHILDILIEIDFITSHLLVVFHLVKYYTNIIQEENATL